MSISKTLLNKEQQEAVMHVNGPMLVLAGPGSGKTHVLIERIIYLIESGINPENILVITFSKQAALEMEGRFKDKRNNKQEGVIFGTFHAIFFSILKYHGIFNNENIMKIKDKQKILEDVALSLKIQNGLNGKWQKEMIEKISFYKNSGDKLFETDSGFNMMMDEKTDFIKVYEKYEYYRNKFGLLDFDDMVLQCYKFLSSNKEALKLWQDKFRYILIDEFQDINASQYSVLSLLEGKSNNVFAVGDDDQSIYGFRGAYPGIMKLFLEDHNGAKQVFLKVNYRSCQSIVKSADLCIRNNTARIQRACQETLKDRNYGKVIIKNFENDILEAEYITDEILHNLSPKEDIAIIYRSDHCVTLLEEKMRSKGIKICKNTKEVFFYDIKEILVICSFFKICVGRAEYEDFLRIIVYLGYDFSRESLLALEKKNNNRISFDDFENTIIDYYKIAPFSKQEIINNELKKLRLGIEYINKIPPQAAIIYLLKSFRLNEAFEKDYKGIKGLSITYKELIEDFKRRLNQFGSIEGFLNHVDSLRNNDISNNHINKNCNEGIKFITAHASKGLEYNTVFVVGLQEGLFPHRKKLEEPGIEEERRLFYVAMTRAKEKLYIIGRGSLFGKRTSRFLNEIQSNQSFIASNSSLSRNSSNASATASYSSSSSI